MSPVLAPYDGALPALANITSLAESQLDALLVTGSMVTRHRREMTPQYKQRIADFMQLQREAADGDLLKMHIYREVLSSSDFGTLFTDVLDRKVEAGYTSWPTIWPGYVKKAQPLRDFREVERVLIDGYGGRWDNQYRKPELTNVTYDQGFQHRVVKYQPVNWEKGYAVSWQSLVNDNLDVLSDIPQSIVEGGRKTQDYYVTTFYAGTTGPLNTVYTVGNRNIINQANGAAANNPALSFDALEDAYTVLRGQRDPVTGEPIMITAAVLVVPPSLEATANHILFGRQVTFGGQGQTGRGGTAGTQIIADNTLRSSVRLVVNPYLPFVSTTNGNTSWYLFADPDRGRAAIEIGFLRGFDTPVLLRKKSDIEPAGGGGGGPEYMMGDFESGAIYYKAVQIYGGNVIDPLATVASNGTGT